MTKKPANGSPSAAKPPAAKTELTDEQKATAAEAAGVASFDELTDEQKEAAIAAAAQPPAPPAASKKGTAQARLLVDHEIDGKKLPVNRVISGDTKTIAQLVEGGVADSHADAVAYALSLNKTVISI